MSAVRFYFGHNELCAFARHLHPEIAAWIKRKIPRHTLVLRHDHPPVTNVALAEVAATWLAPAATEDGMPCPQLRGYPVGAFRRLHWTSKNGKSSLVAEFTGSRDHNCWSTTYEGPRNMDCVYWRAVVRRLPASHPEECLLVRLQESSLGLPSPLRKQEMARWLDDLARGDTLNLPPKVHRPFRNVVPPERLQTIALQLQQRVPPKQQAA